MQIDYNQIFDAVTLALHDALPETRIFGEHIEQGLEEDAINVLPISANETAQLGTRALRNVMFDVIYYPTRQKSREACLRMQDTLAGVLGTVTTPNGDKIHCLKFDGTITDDVLHCIVSYPHFIYVPAEKEMMADITLF